MNIDETIRREIIAECNESKASSAAAAVVRLLERYAAKEILPARMSAVLQDVYELLQASDGGA